MLKKRDKRSSKLLLSHRQEHPQHPRWWRWIHLQFNFRHFAALSGIHRCCLCYVFFGMGVKSLNRRLSTFIPIHIQHGKLKFRLLLRANCHDKRDMMFAIFGMLSLSLVFCTTNKPYHVAELSIQPTCDCECDQEKSFSTQRTNLESC